MDQEPSSAFNGIQPVYVIVLIAILWRIGPWPAIQHFLLAIDAHEQHPRLRRLLTYLLSSLLSILLLLGLNDYLYTSLTRPIVPSNDATLPEKIQVQYFRAEPAFSYTLLDSVNLGPSDSINDYHATAPKSVFDDLTTSVEQESSWPSNSELPNLEGYELALLSVPQEERTSHWWQTYQILSMNPPLADQWESTPAAEEPETHNEPAPQPASPPAEMPSLVSEWKAKFVAGVKYPIYLPVRLYHSLCDALYNLIFTEPPWLTNREWMLKQPRFHGIRSPHPLNPLLRVKSFVWIRVKHSIFQAQEPEQERHKIHISSIPSTYIVGSPYDEEEMERVYREMLAGPSSAGPSFVSTWTHDQWESWKRASEYTFDFYNNTHYPFTNFVIEQMKHARP